eukprot:gnl/MRDRNA2_/MRDRNA2_326604_c0_seq1.p1 gnl/MRDRNA2_/MRDRNA2_326604_c0~~gnl/MRDRNA2_/MRDRNA2_326604_c0_seq1.p1  ORF type:complete len:230 (-),score=2.28 gnl/MRDRNA2_/MRDRNA2_326604_c0_seq1:42-656(-)
MSVLWILSMIPHALILGSQMNIFNSNLTSVSVFKNLATTHPLTYWPSFVFGMGLARVFLEFEIGKAAPNCFLSRTFGRLWEIFSHGGASFSYVVLLLLFSYGTPWRRYLWWQHGLLLVPFSAVLLGLARGKDPLCRMFSHRYAQLLGDMSFPLYILQNCTLRASQFWFKSLVDWTIIYPLVAIVFSYAGYFWVVLPYDHRNLTW